MTDPGEMSEAEREADWLRTVERFILNGRGPENEFEARAARALAYLTDKLARVEATREEFRALNLRALANERDALAQVERLREALREIKDRGGHSRACAARLNTFSPEWACDCGWNKVVEHVDSALAATEAKL